MDFLNVLAVYILPMIACGLYTYDRWCEAKQRAFVNGDKTLAYNNDVNLSLMWVCTFAPIFNIVMMIFVCANLVLK